MQVTTLQLGSWNTTTDSFSAHPRNPNGTILDLNDGTNFTLTSQSDAGDGLDWGQPLADTFKGKNPRSAGQAVRHRNYSNNRMVKVHLYWGVGSSYAQWINNLHTLIKTCEGIAYDTPGALKVQVTTASLPIYVDVYAAQVEVPYNELKWAQLIEDGLVVTFECKPFLRGDRVQLQNLILNPGFEVPGGTPFTAFNDPLANTLSYATQVGANPTIGYAAQVLIDAPVGFWRLNESSGTVAKDNSGINTNNGTITGTGVTYSTTPGTTNDPTAAALTFDGSAGAVSMINAVTGNDFSVSFWIKTSAAGAGTTFLNASGVVSATTGATQNDWGIGLNSSGKIVFGTGNADTTITAAAASNNGAWHHVVCTRVKSTGAMVLYIDGASSATGTGGTNTLSTPTTIWLARQATGGNFLACSLSEVAVYTVALNAAQVSDEYAARNGTGAYTITTSTTYAAQITADSAVLYYRLGDAASPLAATIGTGTLTVGGSGTTFNTTGALTGDANGSITLNGSGTIQGTATTPSAISGTWAVECWIKNGGTGKIWGGRGTSDIGSDCQINASGATAVHLFFHNGASNVAFDTNYTWPGTGWSHIVVNATATTWELWINNVKVNNGALTFSPILINDASNGDLNVGWNGIVGDPHWNSAIDEFAIYTANLGSGTINTHYLLGTTGPTSAATLVGSNTLALPVGSTISYGSPAWKEINNAQMRFRWTTSLVLIWVLHYQDANNSMQVQVDGANLIIQHTIAGVTTSTSVACALTNGNWYWAQYTQFPAASTVVPILQAIVSNDATGAIGSQVATTGTAVAASNTQGLAGAMRIKVTGAVALVGGNYANVLETQLFGPGGWSTSLLANVSPTPTAYASAAWDSATTYTGSVVKSQYAARIDAPPSGTWGANIATYRGGTPTGTSAIPVATGQVIQASYWYKSSGMSASSFVQLVAVEYDATGTFLRNGVITQMVGNSTSWTQVTASWTAGASAGWVNFLPTAADVSAAGASANATVWFDNCQMWNQTLTGTSTMAYCELRFPQSPAPLLLSGLLGDIAAPLHVAVGTYITGGLVSSNAINYRIARRRSAAWSAPLIGASLTTSPDGVNNTMTLDSTAWSGYKTTYRNVSGTYAPLWISNTLNNITGTYHLFVRLKVLDASPTTHNLQPDEYLTQTIWLPAGGSRLGVFQGSFVYPWTTNNLTVFDAGQLIIPAYPADALGDPSQVYASIICQNTTATTGMDCDWGALLPVDGEQLTAVFQNNSTGATLNGWIWAYFDGINASSSWSLENVPTSNVAHASGGPGSVSQGAPSINPTGDSTPKIDPTVTTTNGSTTNAGVNQFLVVVDQASTTNIPIAIDISYSPLYLYPR